MAGFKQLSGLVVPLDAANVDTDAIIPKQFLQAITRVGFGKHLFHEWRYLDVEGTKPNPDFVLNYPQYQGATILLARKNLGCGSSREHAPWALADYGFKWKRSVPIHLNGHRSSLNTLSNHGYAIQRPLR